MSNPSTCVYLKDMQWRAHNYYESLVSSDAIVFRRINYVIFLDKRTWTKGHEAVLDLSQKLYAVNNPQHTSKTRNTCIC